jgi:C1A family cysteine protease
VTINGQTIQNTILGAHAIQIVGWAVDSTSGLNYWICQNQWGSSFGDGGYFYIQKGVNESNIEFDVCELSVNASNFSKLGSGMPLETTFNSSETEWWIW